MAIITFEFPQDVFSALRKSPAEFAREMRLAAAVEWYAEGIVSQGKAAGIAGVSRAEFLDELTRRRVSASQATLEELRDEIRRG
jgi:predicted HTH domain antitoxin